MKGIYLASYRAYHPGHDIVYQDINGLRDLGGDMMDVDLSEYDFIIATPPCNYFSRGNWRRNCSEYSLNTRHLLPGILRKLCYQDKPFIVENVRNFKMFNDLGLFDLPCFVYFIGRHTYWSNMLLSTDVPQIQDHIWTSSQANRQGGFNVHQVIEMFLKQL